MVKQYEAKKHLGFRNTCIHISFSFSQLYKS